MVGIATLGVFGGTFDPPHYGHLIPVEQAREQLNLARILWIPAAEPPHKQEQLITPIEHRLAMLRLALNGNPAFEISLVDVQRPGPHYSVDMLALLKEAYPSTEFTFLVGSDSLRDIPMWHQPARLIEMATLGVMPRPGAMPDLTALERALPGLNDQVTFVDSPLVEISGSDIEERVAHGRSIRYLLPSTVEAYIYTHNLYTTDDRGPHD